MPSRGTGLGLSIYHGLVRGYRWRRLEATTKHEGTVFSIILATAPDLAAADLAAGRPQPLQRLKMWVPSISSTPTCHRAARLPV